jgi:VanZ family protein
LPAIFPGGLAYRVKAIAPWFLLAAALLFVLFFGDAPERTIFWDAFFDVGHVPLFGLLAVAVLRVIRARHPEMPASRAWRHAFLLVLAAGVATELIQHFQPNREPSLEDLARDAAGAAAFLLVAAAWPAVGGGETPVSSRRGRVAAVAVAVALVTLAGAALASTVAVLVERDRSMPVLASFDGSWWERRLIRPGSSVLTPGGRPANLSPAFREPLARLDLKPGTYPGVRIDEPCPDWRGYQRLVFTIVSDLDAPFRLTIRVHDARHDQRTSDRFNRALAIAPGVNRFAIPLDEIRLAPDRREMDMSRIRGIIIFGYRLDAPMHVFISPLRLE